MQKIEHHHGSYLIENRYSQHSGFINLQFQNVRIFKTATYIWVLVSGNKYTAAWDKSKDSVQCRCLNLNAIKAHNEALEDWGLSKWFESTWAMHCSLTTLFWCWSMLPSKSCILSTLYRMFVVFPLSYSSSIPGMTW